MIWFLQEGGGDRRCFFAFVMLAVLVGTLWIPTRVSAHEAYVLDHDTFWSELAKPSSPHAIKALEDPHNLLITIYITIGVLILLIVNFLFRRSRIGEIIHRWPERYARFGPMFVRFAIATAFFFSATSGGFLGTELLLESFAYPEFVRWGLFITSFMIAFGVFTELAALIGLTMYGLAYQAFGAYILTYANYLGELLVLFFFGMRRWSIDARIFGKLSQARRHYEKYETTIVRILYGFGLIYAGLTVKFLHPDLTTLVATEWNLTQFHLLFPSDPLLVTFGAGLAEIAIGIFIILGFEMRLTVLISLFYITLSLLYFRELVWPHYMLYGISINLLLQPETFTIDHLLFRHHRHKKPWWLRPFAPHHFPGKSTGEKLRPD